jgi:hypothetical protein
VIYRERNVLKPAGDELAYHDLQDRIVAYRHERLWEDDGIGA